ncbi:hypothetical protein [Streptomyces mirabilis]|uniref:hypothetical protein n=1 Tax=Streptomyces mirabilis TaxID=68239 RepID=UPI0028F71E27|nr:hypothetical protein [Streptomyces mirabilis]
MDVFDTTAVAAAIDAALLPTVPGSHERSLPPDEEIAAMKALAEAFPGSPLRLDPNTAWTVETSR